MFTGVCLPYLLTTSLVNVGVDCLLFKLCDMRGQEEHCTRELLIHDLLHEHVLPALRT